LHGRHGRYQAMPSTKARTFIPRTEWLYPPTPTTAPVGGDAIRVVQGTGRMPANPYLRQAWEITKFGIMRIFTDEMRKELEKAAARLAKKAERGTLTKRQREGLLKR
ncbi:MAG: hypothetical protein PHQ43_01715, partial [Dehalococcoidales bacterium]|nr:hypothetical protein [Dehalococcoidales bacterium]